MQNARNKLPLFLAVLGSLAVSGYPTTLLHRNLQELAVRADRIFVGTCVSAQEKQTTQYTYTEYTFEVIEDVKNASNGRVVLRQFGRAGGVGTVIGMPQYQLQEKYLLFLRNESEYGLSSPIGFGQGAFEVQRQGKGEVAINGFGNLGLFKGMELPKAGIQMAESFEAGGAGGGQGPLNLKILISAVRELTAGNRRQEESK